MENTRWAIVVPNERHIERDMGVGPMDADYVRSSVTGKCSHCGRLVDRDRAFGNNSWGWHGEKLLTDDEVVVMSLDGRLRNWLDAEDEQVWEERKKWLGTR